MEERGYFNLSKNSHNITEIYSKAVFGMGTAGTSLILMSSVGEREAHSICKLTH
jgi:hypothetical protein